MGIMHARWEDCKPFCIKGLSAFPYKNSVFFPYYNITWYAKYELKTSWGKRGVESTTGKKKKAGN